MYTTRTSYYIVQWLFYRLPWFQTWNLKLFLAPASGTNRKAYYRNIRLTPMPISTISSTPSAMRSRLLHRPMKLTRTRMKTYITQCFLNPIHMSLPRIQLNYMTPAASPRRTRLLPSDPNRRLHPRHQPNGNVERKNHHLGLQVLPLRGLLMKRRNFVSWKPTSDPGILGKPLRQSWARRNMTSELCGRALKTNLSDLRDLNQVATVLRENCSVHTQPFPIRLHFFLCFCEWLLTSSRQFGIFLRL